MGGGGGQNYQPNIILNVISLFFFSFFFNYIGIHNFEKS
jgi:hypothetical protein